MEIEADAAVCHREDDQIVLELIMTTSQLSSDYAADGMLAAVDLLSPDEAKVYRENLCQFVADHHDNEAYGAWIYGKSHLVLKWVADIARHPRVLDHVEQILGPNILLWDSFVPTKPPHSDGHFGWHQDGTFWPIAPLEETVAVWLALDDVSPKNGGMRMVPGSWRLGQLDHEVTYDPVSMLRRGQRVTDEIDENKVVDIVLKPGQASFHGHLTLHQSGPNQSDRRRLGVGLNYVSSAVSPTEGQKASALLVRVSAEASRLNLETPPKSDLHPDALAQFAWSQELGKKRYADVAAAT